jgi:hypothetical protein
VDLSVGGERLAIATDQDRRVVGVASIRRGFRDASCQNSDLAPTCQLAERGDERAVLDRLGVGDLGGLTADEAKVLGQRDEIRTGISCCSRQAPAFWKANMSTAPRPVWL